MVIINAYKAQAGKPRIMVLEDINKGVVKTQASKERI